MQLSLARTTHVEMPLCRGSRREDVYKIARKFRLRDQGGWGVWIHGIFALQGGVAMGGAFSATNHVLPIPGGLAMGGSFSATNHVLPIPVGGWPWGGCFQLRTAYSRFRRGGWPWGGRFQLRTMYSRFRLEKPVQRAGISGASRLNACTHFPGGRRGRLAGPGNAGPGPAGQAVLRSPEGPF